MQEPNQQFRCTSQGNLGACNRLNCRVYKCHARFHFGREDLQDDRSEACIALCFPRVEDAEKSRVDSSQQISYMFVELCS